MNSSAVQTCHQNYVPGFGAFQDKEVTFESRLHKFWRKSEPKHHGDRECGFNYSELPAGWPTCFPHTSSRSWSTTRNVLEVHREFLHSDFLPLRLPPSSHLQVSRPCWLWPPWARWPGTHCPGSPTWRPWTSSSLSASCLSSLPWSSTPCSTTTPTACAGLPLRHGEWYVYPETVLLSFFVQSAFLSDLHDITTDGGV